MTLGQNGLFTRARAGAAAYNESEVRDDLSMLITQYTWDKASEKTDKSLGDYLKDNGATSVKANAVALVRICATSFISTIKVD